MNDSLYSGELTEISSKAIVKTIRFIRNDISEHGTTYVEAFPHECYLPSITAPAYYKLVSAAHLEALGPNCHYVTTSLGTASCFCFSPDAFSEAQVSSYVKSFLGAASVKTFPQAYVV